MGEPFVGAMVLRRTHGIIDLLEYRRGRVLERQAVVVEVRHPLDDLFPCPKHLHFLSNSRWGGPRISYIPPSADGSP